MSHLRHRLVWCSLAVALAAIVGAIITSSTGRADAPGSAPTRLAFSVSVPGIQEADVGMTRPTPSRSPNSISHLSTGWVG